jgi:Phage tail lysozyme
MAQLPTIASTSNRRILPSADLRVDGVTPAAFGSAVGAGLQQIGEAGQQAGAALGSLQLARQQEEERLAEFDRQTKFVEFGAHQSERLAEATRTIAGPAQNFTQTFMRGADQTPGTDGTVASPAAGSSFDADASAFLAAVPERLRPQWQARMAQLRAGVAGDALRTEFTQRDSYYKTTIGNSLSQLQNGAMSTPDRLDDWRTQGEQVIATSGLSVQDKLEYTTRWRGQVAVAAAQGDVQRDPEGAMQRLGGIDFIVETQDGGYASGTATYSRGGQATLKGDIIGFFKAKGVSEAVARGIAAGVESEASGDHGAVNPTSGALGLGQWLGPRKEALIARYGNSPTRGQQLEFLYSELQGGDRGGPAVLAAKDEGQAVDRYVRGFMRPGADTEGGIRRGMKALGYRVQEGAPAGANTTTRTIGDGVVDPRYADIPIDARAQLIGAAERGLAQRDRQVEAAQQEQHSTWLNEFMNNLNDGTAGTTDIEAARKSGRLTDFGEINRAQGVAEARERQNVDINTYNSLVAEPGFTWNPYDERQRKAVDAAVASQGGAPQAAFDVWQRTGILGKAGAVALRGTLISTDPAQVSAGASIASNMLARNPNAFAGVEGGDEIERSALLYGHYVNDLGASPQDAARRVAEQNAPEMRRKIAMGQPEVAAFRKTIQGADVAGTLGRALDTTYFGGTPSFVGPEQRQAASQDYADLAADHFARYGDSSAAQSYAMAQMRRLYGVVNGRLMKYPPTRAYPVIAGSQQYVFDQAAADIRTVTGRTVDPKNVYLMPVPTATAEAFRKGDAPPYEVHYVDQVDGQNVYRVLTGKVFYADPSGVARAAGEANQARLAKERQDYLAREQFQRGATIARFGYLPGVTDQYPSDGRANQARLAKERQDYVAREQFQRGATIARFGYLPGVTDQYPSDGRGK